MHVHLAALLNQKQLGLFLICSGICTTISTSSCCFGALLHSVAHV